MIERLSEHLYRFRDSCWVYALVRDDEAALIDFGSGAILDALAAEGIARVGDVFMTHHHRDQGQGLTRAVEAGIGIWVPHSEQELFAEVDAHWQARELANSYNNRQDRFSLLEPVPLAGTLRDYARVSAVGIDLTVVPTPGHTPGSITLFGEVDGRRTAFSGDLIAGPGKLWSLAATQWSYNGAQGVAAGVASLLDLAERAPERLLPSHGELMDAPLVAIGSLVDGLLELLAERCENPRLLELRERPYEILTPHLLRNRTSEAYGYVLLSEAKVALCIDFGYDFCTGLAVGSDRAARRPWLYTLAALKRDFGVERVEVALPTHYHDDHVAGFELLHRVEGAEVWAPESFADLLLRPENYDLPCLWYDPVPVDRRLPLETPIRWREYEFTLHDQPGHTRYAVAVSFTVDGVRALAIGDQYQGGAEKEWNYVYNNGFDPADYRRSAELYRRLRPDLLLSGHWEPYRLEPGYLDLIERRGRRIEALHHRLLPLDTVDFGGVDTGISIHPYRSRAAPGQPLAFGVEVRNPFARAAEAEVALVLPAGWRAEPAVARLRLEPHARGDLRFTVTPGPTPVRRARIAADLSVDGTRFGQQAEALVTLA